MPSPFGLKFHLLILSLDANWYENCAKLFSRRLLRHPDRTGREPLLETKDVLSNGGLVRLLTRFSTLSLRSSYKLHVPFIL